MTDTQLTTLSVKAIKRYLNNDNLTDEDILTDYADIIELVKLNITNSLNRDSNLASITEGARSVSFKDSDTIISDTIKALLPRPFIKLY